MSKTLFAVLALACLSSCSPAPKAIVPESWRSGAGGEPLDPAASEAIEGQVARFVELNAQVVESGAAGLLASKASAVPWHLEYFMTDLSVSASGVLGALIGRGAPAVSFSWRRQYERKPPALSGQLPAADFEIVAGKTAEEVSLQLEPVIRALVKAGFHEAAVRPELERAARSFVEMTGALERTGGGPWWASRFRMDVVIEASTAVTPILSAGGEIRLRFEWHRMMPKKPRVAKAEAKGQLEEFVEGMTEEVASAVMDADELREVGFEPYQFRVGVGYTAKGTIGIAKAQGTLIGHLYFSRDVPKPEVNPSPSPLSKGTGSEFKKGLDRAFKIAAVFARGARRAEAGAKPSHRWKVYEMKTAFDISLSESLGLAEVGGIGTAEINFYNQKF